MINLSKGACVCWLTTVLILSLSTILTCYTVTNRHYTGTRMKDVQTQIIDIMTIASWVSLSVAVLFSVLFMALGPSILKPACQYV